MLLTNEKKPQRGRAEASPIEGCWVGEYPARKDYRKFVSKCAVVCFKFYLSSAGAPLHRRLEPPVYLVHDKRAGSI
jgi:hypothetical protein